MSHTPWFFVTLGLAPSTDQQAIRRAYAAALKRLDQQLQAEEFQQLRQAYELARQWRETEEVQEDSLPIEQPIAPEPHPAPSKVRPIEISAAEANSQAEPALIDLSRLEEEQQAALAEWTQRLCQPELQEAQALLDQALADPRLGLDVREDLERQLLTFLRQSDAANQPLFEAAANAFAWRSHSLQIEHSAWIEAYLQEEDQWLAQEKVAQARQMTAIGRLLKDGPLPSRRRIRQCWPLLIKVRQQYPHWLRLHLGEERCQYCQNIYGVEPWASAAESDPEQPKKLGYRRLPFLLSSLICPPFFLVWWWKHRRALKNPEQAGDIFAESSTGILFWIMFISMITLVSALNQAKPIRCPGSQCPIGSSITAESCALRYQLIKSRHWRASDNQENAKLLYMEIFLCAKQGFWPDKQDPLIQSLNQRVEELRKTNPQD